MHFTPAFVLGLQISTVLSMPTTFQSRSELSDISEILRSLSQGSKGAAAGQAAKPAASSSTKGEAKVAKPAKAAAGKAAVEEDAVIGEDAAVGEEEGEVEIEGVFGTPVAVEGGDIKQDILFTKSATGAFEFEFQAATADTVTVTENKNPAAAPAGFTAIEPSSFQVALTSKGVGLTLSKIDYIFDGTNAALAAMDLTAAQVGKLCAETGAFVIDAALGEIEFELEENEVTLDLNKAVTAEGEWGIFLPVAAAGAAAGVIANGTAEVAVGNATAPVGKEAAAKGPKAVAGVETGMVTAGKSRAGKKLPKVV